MGAGAKGLRAGVERGVCGDMKLGLACHPQPPLQPGYPCLLGRQGLLTVL